MLTGIINISLRDPTSDIMEVGVNPVSLPWKIN
jgi:hypothetical protein